MKIIYSSSELVKLMLAKGLEKKWTMPTLLNHFGISGASFSRMKCGKQVPSFGTYIRICEKLGLPLSVEKKSEKKIPKIKLPDPEEQVTKLPRKVRVSSK